MSTPLNKQAAGVGARWKALGPWARTAVAAIVLVIVLLAVVLAARWFVILDPVQSFLKTYPGQSVLPESAPVGFPAWLGWQHFLNMFFIILIIRSGWQVRTTKRPAAHWVRNNKGLIKTKNAPTKISLDLWFHQTLDALWVLNGIVFIVVLFFTGQWMRIVPTSWDIVPNAISAGLQYLSLDWPTENGWVNYNGLQLLTYFITVFIAAPLAIATGLRMSGAWPKNARTLNRIYPIQAARALHFPVMIYFVGFIVVHVTLVLATGALRNLNHMYASSDVVNWWGFGIFALSLVVMAAAWFLATPLFLRPIASLMGKVTK
ncbi:cytochrome b/b6 domain-containing protein [Arthrobacter sp. H35-D1]|uniref:cytochrome b/b6 domain-containing protein n=1 Tax=Arthrobacter sp. H35-D1 TaxID=3046202 RepID=UPI0024BA8D71|nr:cytochrome b/b6 domain-containing protein [Arthrobacter sp. H35-D1]MDJ0314333.1 cytochrome b/b6 domain-containing protein [Arthrobacter sp. H35-D1]